MGDGTSKTPIVACNNSAGVGVNSDHPTAVAAFGSHHVSLSVCICPHERASASVREQAAQGHFRIENKFFKKQNDPGGHKF